jgi:hypothetical protein
MRAKYSICKLENKVLTQVKCKILIREVASSYVLWFANFVGFVDSKNANKCQIFAVVSWHRGLAGWRRISLIIRAAVWTQGVTPGLSGDSGVSA